jgi:hypothetical protein
MGKLIHNHRDEWTLFGRVFIGLVASITTGLILVIIAMALWLNVCWPTWSSLR